MKATVKTKTLREINPTNHGSPKVDEEDHHTMEEARIDTNETVETGLTAVTTTAGQETGTKITGETPSTTTEATKETTTTTTKDETATMEETEDKVSEVTIGEEETPGATIDSTVNPETGFNPGTDFTPEIDSTPETDFNPEIDSSLETDTDR